MRKENPTLLLVEDSEDDAFLFTRTVQKSGCVCSVHHVAHGVQALQFLQAGLDSNAPRFPEVIFLDLKMPGMNGFEVLEWIRAQRFPHEMQVIILSGSEHPDDKSRAARLGAKDYLVKPIDVGDLRRLLPACCWANPAMTV